MIAHQSIKLAAPECTTQTAARRYYMHNCAPTIGVQIGQKCEFIDSLLGSQNRAKNMRSHRGNTKGNGGLLWTQTTM